VIPTRVSLAFAIFLVACSGSNDLGEQVGHASANLVICPDGDTQEGIDVSYFQGTVDWDAALADGVTFAIARVSQGDFMDPEFQTNWQGIKEAGALRVPVLRAPSSAARSRRTDVIASAAAPSQSSTVGMSSSDPRQRAREPAPWLTSTTQRCAGHALPSRIA